MKLFLSHRKLINRMHAELRRIGIEPDEWKEEPTAGYKRDIIMVRQVAEDEGWEIVDDVYGADLELFIGPIFEKCRPYMHPAIIFTMFEHEWSVTKECVESINTYDACIVPSKWCMDLFKRKGVKVPIYYCPHWIDEEFFKPVERDWNGKFRLLSIATSLVDRKGAWQVMRWFASTKDKLPNDVELVIKTSKTRFDYDLSSADRRVRLVGEELPAQEYSQLLTNSLLLMYPSSGEGFGLIPGECARTGMAVAVSPISALKTEYLDKSDGFIEIKGRLVKMPNSPTTGFLMDYDWTTETVMRFYEYRDELRKLAEIGQRFVIENLSYSRLKPRIVKAITETLERSIKRETLPELRIFDYFLGSFRLMVEGTFKVWAQKATRS